MKFWDKYGWIIISVLSIVFLIIAAIWKDNSKINDFSFLFKNHKTIRKQKNTPTYHTPQSDVLKSGYVSKGEEECRKSLERIFNKPFYKIRPHFLKNDVTGKNLELDLYNPDLKLCVEMNGKQHYQYNPYFHKNNEAFLNQRYRDEMKKTKCKENGVNFIEVPYTIKLHQIEDFLRMKIKELGYMI